MKDAISDEARVEHITECIAEIENALEGANYEEFINNHVLRIAVVKWLEIIGEAANQEVRGKNDTIEWFKMIGLRNIAVHEYFGINYKTIWETPTVSLQQLKKEITTIKLD